MTTYLTLYKPTPAEVYDIRIAELYTNVDENDFLVASLKNPCLTQEFIVEVQPHKFTLEESERRYSELNEQLTVNQELEAQNFFEDLMKENDL